RSAPSALGGATRTMRPALSADTQAAISVELAKDYTNMPDDEIERHLAA
ncbi:host attachment protein, partial [Rhizobium leguminosarum]